MGLFELLATLLTLAALFSFASHRWLGLPGTIGVFLLAFAFSFATISIGSHIVPADVGDWEKRLIQAANLPDTLLQGALAFLLFAGAIEQNGAELWRRRASVVALATVGVGISTLVTGGAMWWIYRGLGLDIPFLWCLVLGAALAPTDPVAVLAVLQHAPLPPGLRATISGESLFNDGIGVVLFTVLLGAATGGGDALTIGSVALDFVREAGGGVALGLITGAIAYQAKRRAGEASVELTISLALVAATYAVAQRLGMSGPLAVVVAGLLIGGTADRHVSSLEAGRIMTAFWSMVDAVLNAMLFLLVGLEASAVMTWNGPVVLAALAAPFVMLASRLAGVMPVVLAHHHYEKKTRAAAVLTWSGVRGGIAVALVLSLPQNDYQEALLAACYAVVAFTIVVQGMTLERLVRWSFPQGTGR